MSEWRPTPPVDDPLHECWVITNGAAGNERQALALAECLPWPIRTLIAEPRAPWSWCAPRCLPGARLAWPQAVQPMLAPPWPPLVIGCGRAAALFTRLLRQCSHGACRSVQILDPRIDPRHWDVVIAPDHDGLEGDNVLNPLGSLHPIDDGWLSDAREAWAHLASLPAPRLAVLLGGPRHGIAMDAAYARTLAEAILTRHRRDGGSVLLLASRRTPPALFEHLRQAFDGLPGLCWGSDADGANPYPGVLGWADRLVVTPDSVNMLSEACATGRPVHTLVMPPLPDKLARFHAGLRARGLLHAMEAETPSRQPALRETRAIADALRERLGFVNSASTQI
ncbi:MAG TPA: mitochondrial fission ELM1 family protein [Oleiagrimonas sp.]|nr:mitochondrial fission ELM1 family protein [Oleiagrimonas sp.]